MYIFRWLVALFKGRKEGDIRKIEDIRIDINRVDGQMIKLIARRMELSGQVADYKRHNNLPVRDIAREKEQVLRIIKECERLGVKKYTPYILIILRMVIEVSVIFQIIRLGMPVPWRGGRPDHCVFCGWRTGGDIKPDVGWPECRRCGHPLTFDW